MGIKDFEDAPKYDVEIGHLRARWTFLDNAAGCAGAGVRRLAIPAGGWSSPPERSLRQFWVAAT